MKITFIIPSFDEMANGQKIALLNHEHGWCLAQKTDLMAGSRKHCIDIIEGLSEQQESPFCPGSVVPVNILTDERACKEPGVGIKEVVTVDKATFEELRRGDIFYHEHELYLVTYESKEADSTSGWANKIIFEEPRGTPPNNPYHFSPETTVWRAKPECYQLAE